MTSMVQNSPSSPSALTLSANMLASQPTAYKVNFTLFQSYISCNNEGDVACEMMAERSLELKCIPNTPIYPSESTPSESTLATTSLYMLKNQIIFDFIKAFKNPNNLEKLKESKTKIKKIIEKFPGIEGYLSEHDVDTIPVEGPQKDVPAIQNLLDKLDKLIHLVEERAKEPTNSPLVNSLAACGPPRGEGENDQHVQPYAYQNYPYCVQRQRVQRQEREMWSKGAGDYIMRGGGPAGVTESSSVSTANLEFFKTSGIQDNNKYFGEIANGKIPEGKDFIESAFLGSFRLPIPSTYNENEVVEGRIHNFYAAIYDIKSKTLQLQLVQSAPPRKESLNAKALVVLAFDVSGSMGTASDSDNTRMGLVKKVADQFLRTLPSESLVALCQFDDEPRAIDGFPELLQPSLYNKNRHAAFMKAIHSLQPSGGTDVGKCVTFAYKICNIWKKQQANLEGNAIYRPSVVLVTDAQHNEWRPEAINEETKKAFTNDGIRTHCIGIGSSRGWGDEGANLKMVKKVINGAGDGTTVTMEKDIESAISNFQFITYFKNYKARIGNIVMENLGNNTRLSCKETGVLGAQTEGGFMTMPAMYRTPGSTEQKGGGGIIISYNVNPESIS